MLRTHPAKPVPTNCGQCEFSFALGNVHTTSMACCVRDNTHHNCSQPLCSYYVRLGVGDLRVELAFQVPPWLRAIAIRDLPQPASLEAIVNIIQDRGGKVLATIQEKKDEKPAENKTTH